MINNQTNSNKVNTFNSNNSNCVSENRISKLCNSRNLTYFRTSVKNNKLDST